MLSLLVVAAMGCNGRSDARQQAVTTATGAETQTLPTPLASPSTVETTTSTEPKLEAGTLDDDRKRVLGEITGIGELRKLASITLVDSRPSERGGEVDVFALDGATPFADSAAVVNVVNSFERLAGQHGQVSFPVGRDGAVGVDAHYVLSPHAAKNHYFFFGDQSFRPSQALPETFANIADPAAPGVSHYQERNPDLNAVSSFLADSTNLRAIDGSLNYGEVALDVEACQNAVYVELSPDFASSVGTSVYEPGAAVLTYDRLKALGQEVVCNSYGVARAAKQTGDTYEQYRPLLQGLKFDLFKDLIVTFLVVDEATYDQL